MDYTTLVPTPEPEAINSGLGAARVATLVELFGPFRDLTDECADVKNAAVAALLETRDVGPFRVTGIKPALDSLGAIFAEVKAAEPELYALTKTEGMLCYRCVRGYPHQPSNHAAGSAVDLAVGGVCPDFDARRVPRGFVALYPYFHRRKWFWGAGYHNGRTDPMHFEASDLLLREWHALGLLRPTVHETAARDS